MADGGEGISYWTRWQVLVCALITAVPGAVAVVVILRAKAEPVRSVDFWIPCWRPIHPLWLLSFRLLVAVAMSWLLYHVLLLRGASAFYFYTQWTFTLVIIYFVIATLISAYGCWNYSKEFVAENEAAKGLLERDPEENIPATFPSRTNEDRNAIKLQVFHELGENEQTARFWRYMMQLMQVVYQTSAGAVMLTDVVFWGLLVPFSTSQYFRLSLVKGFVHSLNAVFLLVDTALNSLPFPPFRMAYFVLWSCIYVIFQWILHALGISWWPYPFLELSSPWAPLWYLCMALVHIPCYGIYILIVKAKNSLLLKILPHAYIRQH